MCVSICPLCLYTPVYHVDTYSRAVSRDPNTSATDDFEDRSDGQSPGQSAGRVPRAGAICWVTGCYLSYLAG